MSTLVGLKTTDPVERVHKDGKFKTRSSTDIRIPTVSFNDKSHPCLHKN